MTTEKGVFPVKSMPKRWLLTTAAALSLSVLLPPVSSVADSARTQYTEGTIETLNLSEREIGPPDPGGIRIVNTISNCHYMGGMEGPAYHVYIQRLSPDGSGEFHVLVRFVGTLGGKRGTLITEASGHRETGNPSDVDWKIVPDSGTGELTGASGTGKVITTDDGEVRYKLWFRVP
jgi:uncharacterized protein DUF3224